jgi:L-cysteine desulfidase
LFAIISHDIVFYMENTKFIELLNREVVVAMGCTEPAASALAGAKASQLLEGVCERAIVETSRDMVKNAMGVGIPNCSQKGINVAVALGVASGNINQGLGILSDVSDDIRKKAALIPIELKMIEDIPPLYIKVTCYSKEHSSCAIISGTHSHFSYLEKDKKVLLDDPLKVSCSPSSDDALDSDFMASVTLKDIIDFSKNLPKKTADLLINAAETNLKIAHHALKQNYGLAVGRVTHEGLNEPPESENEAFELGATLAASASDARMAGCPLPVVINSGSGNQGITITVPVITMARYLGKSDEEAAQALCIAELIGLSLTARKDRLSALCGAFTAAIGTSCGLVYLMGGKCDEMNKAVNVMIGDLTGVICDGAKMTCSLKIYSCIQSADLACKLAMKGFAPGIESGIVGIDCTQSFDFLSRISHEGMEQTDRTILSIMLEKQLKKD